MSGNGEAEARAHHALDRLVFFSDAVFAIAITLLVIEIHPPEELARPSDAALWSALSHRIPGLVAFTISFGVIALFWSNHHRSMALLVRADSTLVWRNFGLLFAIALLPFPTGVIARFFPFAAGQQVYLGVLLLAAVMQWRLLSLAFSGERYFAPDADRVLARALGRRALALSITVAFAIALTFVRPWLGVTALLLIPLTLRLAQSPRWER